MNLERSRMRMLETLYKSMHISLNGVPHSYTTVCVDFYERDQVRFRTRHEDVPRVDFSSFENVASILSRIRALFCNIDYCFPRENSLWASTK